MAIRVFTGGGVLSSAANAFSVNAQSPMTLAAWILASDATAWSATTSMFGIYGPGASPSTAIQIGSRGGSSGICVWTWGGNMLIDLQPHSPIGQWNHYAVTYDGITSWLLYINGTQVASRSTAQQAGNLTQTFVNGFPTGAGSESGNFVIDDAIAVTRRMSEAEIRTIYNVQGPRDGIFQNVLARYTYDDGVIGSNVVTGRDLSATAANMLPSVGTPPVYAPPIAMCNIRRLP